MNLNEFNNENKRPWKPMECFPLVEPWNSYLTITTIHKELSPLKALLFISKLCKNFHPSFNESITCTQENVEKEV